MIDIGVLCYCHWSQKVIYF